MNLKELWMQDDMHVVRFKNIFSFIGFCYRCNITPDNSETYYDEEEGYMYLKYPYATKLW